MAQIRFNPERLEGKRFTVNQDTPFIQLLRSLLKQPHDWLFVRNYDDADLKHTFLIAVEHLLANKEQDPTCAKVWGWLSEHFPESVRPFPNFILIEFVDDKIIEETVDETNDSIGFLSEEEARAAVEESKLVEAGMSGNAHAIKDLFRAFDDDEPQQPTLTDTLLDIFGDNRIPKSLDQ